MTHELPPALAPWSPWLGELVPELHAAVGDAVTALARLLGPLPPLPDPGAIEPSGLDGLRRRGPYERLLLSEWVLADEVPEEFLRRAAAGEHLFHELARVAPQRGRRCLVLVDTGPEQLGGPRLAQLALLVVLARRASLAGAGFGWSSLQAPRALDAAGLRAFPGLRSPTVATRAAVDAALGVFGDPLPADEVFLVGGAGIAVLAGNRPWARIDEVLDDGPDRLRVTVSRPGLSPLARDLPLPTPALRTRWLRDPWRPPADLPPPRPAARPVRGARGRWGTLLPFLRFSADGNRVLAVDVHGTALGFRLPEAQEPARSPIRIEAPTAGATVAAIGWAGGRLQALYQSTGGPVWRGGRAWWETFTPSLPPSAEQPGEVLTWTEGARAGAWFRTVDGTLHEWGRGGFTIRSRACLAIGRRDGRRFYVERGEDWTTRAIELDAHGHASDRGSAGAAQRAVVGSAGPHGVGFVVLESAGAWAALSPERQDLSFPRPAEATLVGAPASWERETPTAGSFRRGVLFLRDGALVHRWLWPAPGEERVLARGVAAAAGGTRHYSRLVAWLEPPATVVVGDLDGVEVVRWSPAEGR